MNEGFAQFLIYEAGKQGVFGSSPVHRTYGYVGEAVRK